MKTCGIIAEYNPFHYGHKYQIERAREESGAKIIVVMSGSFVQRGEPSVYSKLSRVRAAILSGADIVLELPLYYALGSAGYFAAGAVKILTSAGVDELCFGSESGDIKMLYQTAELLCRETDDFKDSLRTAISQGYSFPAARKKALSGYPYALSVIDEPNNILGIEYCKAIISQKSPILPFTVTRTGAGYHDTDISKAFPSATAIRKELAAYNKNALNACPKEARACFQDESPVFPGHLTVPLKQQLLRLGKHELSEIEGVNEGLENVIFEAFPEDTVSEMIMRIKSKRYTYASISRMLMYALLEIKKVDFQAVHSLKIPPYIRILGFRRDAEFLVGQICKKANTPVVTNLKNADLCGLGGHVLQKEIYAGDIRNLASGQKHRPEAERFEPLVIEP